MAEARPQISIIIPCYNEEEGVPQLAQKLTPILDSLQSYSPELVFVDDGSTDSTVTALEKGFAHWQKKKITRHKQNRNLGAALRTGARAAAGNFLFFLDSDCTYEPQSLLQMVPPIATGQYDIVTLSPYHPKGAVVGVPEWRLALSKGLSFLYRLILGSPLYTYTAMVRGMPKEVFWELAVPQNDFSFVAQCLVRGILLRKRILEIPAELQVRRFGQSKIKILRTIRSHLRILMECILFRKALLRHYSNAELA